MRPGRNTLNGVLGIFRPKRQSALEAAPSVASRGVLLFADG